MTRRTAIGSLLILLLSAASAGAIDFKGDEKGEHPGEILAIDTNAKTFTVRIVKLEEKDTHVYAFTDKTTIKDKETGKALTFADLSVGDKVIITGRHKDGKRVAIEIVVKPEKKKEKGKS